MIRRARVQELFHHEAMGWRLPRDDRGRERMAMVLIDNLVRHDGSQHGLALSCRIDPANPVAGCDVAAVTGTWRTAFGNGERPEHDTLYEQAALEMLSGLGRLDEHLPAAVPAADRAMTAATDLLMDDPLATELGAVRRGPPLLDLASDARIRALMETVVTPRATWWPRHLNAAGEIAPLVVALASERFDVEESCHEELNQLVEALGFTDLLRAAGSADPARAAELCRHSTADPSLAQLVYFGDTASPSALFRQQFAQSMPAFTGELARLPSWRRAVDSCQPIKPLLEAAGMPAAFCKRINRLAIRAGDAALSDGQAPLFRDERPEGEDAIGVNRARRATPPCGWSMKDALEVLAKGPVDRVPASIEEWRAFADLLGSVALPMRDLLDIPPERALAMPGNVGGSWTRFRAALLTAAGLDSDDPPGRRDRLALATIDVMEAVDNLARQVVIPASWQLMAGQNRSGEVELLPTGDQGLEPVWMAAVDVARSMLLQPGPGRPEPSGSPAARLLAISRREISRRTGPGGCQEILGAREHDVERVADVQRPNVIGAREWLPLIDPAHLVGGAHAVGGVRFTPLTSRHALEVEGNEMCHCIGGGHYARRGMEGNSHYFHVTDRDGIQSTIHIYHTEPGGEPFGELRIGSHHGYGNRRPTKDAKRAARALVRQLNDGALPLHPATGQWRDWLRHSDAAERRNRRVRMLHEFCGWELAPNFKSPEHVGRLWHIWSNEILAGGWRGAGIDRVDAVRIPGLPAPPARAAAPVPGA